jgi:hypothetical protein
MRSAFVVVVLEEERGDRLGLRLAEDVRLAAVDDDEARVLVDGRDEALGRRRSLACRLRGGPRARGLGAARPLGVLRLAALGALARLGGGQARRDPDRAAPGAARA